jgi:hypothetical protein
MSLSVRINHDYTISVIDSKNRELSFRDLRGSDLEFIDSVLKNEEDESKARELELDHIVSILSALCVKNVNFKSLPRRIILEIFDKVREHILCNYIPKYDWLRQCYSIQNGSFAEVSTMEEVPMSKFIAMIQIHNAAVETVDNPT